MLEYIKEYKVYLKAVCNKSDNTIKNYLGDLQSFFAWNNDKEIDTTRIYEYLGYLTDNNISPSSRNRKLSSIKSYMKYLFKNKYISEDHARDVESCKIGKRLPSFLSLSESKKLLRNIEQLKITKNRIPNGYENKIRDYAILTLFLNCGLRLSELTNISLEDIDLEQNTLSVIGKGNKQRIVPLNNSCINSIKKYLEIRPQTTDKALFISKKGNRISNRMVQVIVKNSLETTGIDTNKFHTHSLRHSCATILYQNNNADLNTIKELLGHNSVATTQIYAHVGNEQLINAVSGLKI